MKCSLVGDRARVLAKFLQFLAKIGADLNMEATADGLILGTANSSNAAFAKIHLCRSFFISLETSDTHANCCLVAMKACAAIFRSMKNVETCHIRMNQTGSKLIIQLHCRENTTKTHFVTIQEQELLTAPPALDSDSVNTLTASQKVFSDILSIFNNTEEELTLEATKKKVTMKNYNEALHANRQQMRTQLSLDPAEFDTYVVDTETNLTFCLKEWRAFLVLAESMNSTIAIKFETTGHPIEFTMHDLDVFEVTLFMSTLSSDLDSSSSVVVLNDSGASQMNGSRRTVAATNKRPHEMNVDDELNALLKKPKGSSKNKSVAQESRNQYSNPDIEDYTNNESGSVVGESNNRWTIARNDERNHHLEVPAIANRVSALSPRPTIHERPNDLEIIFLRDTEDDSDKTLCSIPMPGEEEPLPRSHSTMNTVAETVMEVADQEPIEVPESPVERKSQQNRRAALALFRRCYEPTFTMSNLTGLNRILVENSDEEDE